MLGSGVAQPFLLLAHRTLGHAIYVIGGFGVATAVNFNNSITFGSIVVTIVIVGLAGIFTIRSKIANIWREEAEGERAAKERLQDELIAEKTDRAEFDREQQELRHNLKDEVAGLSAQLKVMEARTDLTSALETIRQMNAELAQSVGGAIMEAMKHTADLSVERDQATHHLLEEIRDKLPSEPITVRDVDAHTK